MPKKSYIASDLLETIGVDPFVSEELERNIDLFDTVIVPSRLMAPAFPPQASGEEVLRETENWLTCFMPPPARKNSIGVRRA